MKIRILGNSIRYRLKRPEVNHFEEFEKVIEVLEFGPEEKDQLRFSLEIYSQSEISVSYDANTTIIKVPQALARKWIETELVGFDAKVDTGKGRTITILVEKDFMCIDGSEEDNEGAYPNPMANC